MRVLFVNTTCGRGSHGKICGELASQHIANGDECRIAYGRESVPEQYQSIAIKIGNKASTYSHVLKSRIFDAHGFGSKTATRKFLQWADTFDPDILWLHNIHGYYLNIELLFQWIKSRPNMQVKWTLHDCWAFTGHCAFFTMARCNQWKTKCNHCPCKRDYPQSVLLDASRQNYERKKKLFTGIQNMTLITPSQWLADLTRESFLSDYPVTVINNQIDTTVFCPTKCDFREKHHIQDKKMVLGVANVWHERKGLRDIILLAHMLDESYQIVLVGLTQRQLDDALAAFSPIEFSRVPYQEIVRTARGIAIPENVSCLYQAITGVSFSGCLHEAGKIIALPRTNSQQELAGLYSTADVFINPTHEDNYPTTNLEAQACGTWTITYDVGGSKETIK